MRGPGVMIVQPRRKTQGEHNFSCILIRRSSLAFGVFTVTEGRQICVSYVFRHQMSSLGRCHAKDIADGGTERNGLQHIPHYESNTEQHICNRVRYITQVLSGEGRVSLVQARKSVVIHEDHSRREMIAWETEPKSKATCFKGQPKLQKADTDVYITESRSRTGVSKRSMFRYWAASLMKKCQIEAYRALCNDK